MRKDQLFKKGSILFICMGKRPFFMSKLHRKSITSLARIFELKKIFIDEGLIQPLNRDIRREKYFELTEKGKGIQENIMAIDKLLEADL